MIVKRREEATTVVHKHEWTNRSRNTEGIYLAESKRACGINKRLAAIGGEGDGACGVGWCFAVGFNLAWVGSSFRPSLPATPGHFRCLG
ncbi:hypothetical protein E2C01_096592 [Portunus trituberculatus]|uniref:Uncharacterized protein n=1 Tax=Portunus trituberculatus TaxID=210409 RepID=A0A5B7K254_PORTR|nr:hypothetical protein [Portunus trituberculatus]